MLNLLRVKCRSLTDKSNRVWCYNKSAEHKGTPHRVSHTHTHTHTHPHHTKKHNHTPTHTHTRSGRPLTVNGGALGQDGDGALDHLLLAHHWRDFRAPAVR